MGEEFSIMGNLRNDRVFPEAYKLSPAPHTGLLDVKELILDTADETSPKELPSIKEMLGELLPNTVNQ